MCAEKDEEEVKEADEAEAEEQEKKRKKKGTPNVEICGAGGEPHYRMWWRKAKKSDE